jgi:hypothetical protein
MSRLRPTERVAQRIGRSGRGASKGTTKGTHAEQKTTAVGSKCYASVEGRSQRASTRKFGGAIPCQADVAMADLDNQETTARTLGRFTLLDCAGTNACFVLVDPGPPLSHPPTPDVGNSNVSPEKHTSTSPCNSSVVSQPRLEQSMLDKVLLLHVPSTRLTFAHLCSCRASCSPLGDVATSHTIDQISYDNPGYFLGPRKKADTHIC